MQIDCYCFCHRCSICPPPLAKAEFSARDDDDELRSRNLEGLIDEQNGQAEKK